MARNSYLANIIENGNSGHFAEQRIKLMSSSATRQLTMHDGVEALSIDTFLKFQQSFTVYCA